MRYATGLLVLLAMCFTSCQGAIDSKLTVTREDVLITSTEKKPYLLASLDASHSYKQILRPGDGFFSFIDYQRADPLGNFDDQAILIKLYHPKDKDLTEFHFDIGALFDTCDHFKKDRYQVAQNPFPIGLVKRPIMNTSQDLTFHYSFLYGVHTRDSGVELWMSSVEGHHHIYIDIMPDYPFYSDVNSYYGRPFDFYHGMLSYIYHDSVKLLYLNDHGYILEPFTSGSLPQVGSLSKSISRENYFLSGIVENITPIANPLDRKLLLQKYALPEYLALRVPTQQDASGFYFIKRDSYEKAKYYETQRKHICFFNRSPEGLDSFSNHINPSASIDSFSNIMLMYDQPAHEIEILDIPSLATSTVNLASIGLPSKDSVISFFAALKKPSSWQVLMIPNEFAEGHQDTFYRVTLDRKMTPIKLEYLSWPQNVIYQHLDFQYIEHSNRYILFSKNKQTQEYALISFCPDTISSESTFEITPLLLPDIAIETIKLHYQPFNDFENSGYMILETRHTNSQSHQTIIYWDLTQSIPSKDL